MQNKTVICIALALASATALCAASPQSPGREGAAMVLADGAQESKLDAALDELAAKAQRGTPTHEDFERLRGVVREFGDANVESDPRSRLFASRVQQAVDALEQRSKSGTLTPAHFDMIREQLVDQRLDRALDQLQSVAGGDRPVASEHFRAISDQLVKRDAVSKSFDPKAAEMRMRMQAELARLQDKNKTAAPKLEDVAAYRTTLLGARLDHAIANLERRASASDLTQAELTRVRGLLEDHAVHAADDPDFVAMHERMKSTLDSLEQSLKSGRVDAVEVARLRDDLPHGPREVVSKKDSPAGRQK
jgi:hypothetical protein